MKRFIYDQIIDQENLCNMQAETDAIMGLVNKRRNVVLYGPRNFGKTSLIKNVIIPTFKKDTPHSFVFFIDLFDIRDIEHLCQLLHKELELSFTASFPAQSLMKKTKEFLQSLQPQISLDSLTSQPSLSLSPIRADRKPIELDDIFKLILAISKHHPTLIVLDEFQAICRIPTLDATFRTLFQQLLDIPIIIMGSQKHMLIDLFSKPTAPLANFGTHVEIKPIDYADYHTYIQERYNPMTISTEATTYIQDRMNRIPESINILADHVLIHSREDHLSSVDDPSYINLIIHQLVENKRSFFEGLLISLSKNEENVLIAIAKIGTLTKPKSKTFISTIRISTSAITKILFRLLQYGFLEFNSGVYTISDPLFQIYLTTYR